MEGAGIWLSPEWPTHGTDLQPGLAPCWLLVFFPAVPYFHIVNNVLVKRHIFIICPSYSFFSISYFMFCLRKLRLSQSRKSFFSMFCLTVLWIQLMYWGSCLLSITFSMVFELLFMWCESYFFVYEYPFVSTLFKENYVLSPWELIYRQCVGLFPHSISLVSMPIIMPILYYELYTCN